jgi:hypothetical protein
VYSQFDAEHYKLTLLLLKTSELDTLRENLKTTDCDFVILEQGTGVEIKGTKVGILGRTFKENYPAPM